MCAANAANTRPETPLSPVGFAGAEHRVGLVHDHDDRAQGADGHENAGLLALGVADPLGAELAHFHHRQPAFAGEAIDQEGFAHADPARDEHAAFEHIGLAVLDQPGQLAQPLLGGGMGGHAVEGHAGLGVLETHQALAVFLDQPLLAGGDVFLR